MKISDLRLLPVDSKSSLDFSGFTCGNEYIDNYLRNERNDSSIAKTYAMTAAGSDKPIGFFSLCTDNVLTCNDEGHLVFSGSAIRIHMFAIRKDFQGLRELEIPTENEPVLITYGNALMNYCLETIFQIADQVGCAFITVFSTRRGYHLYKKIGSFVPMIKVDRNLDSDFDEYEDELILAKDEESIQFDEDDSDFIPMIRMLYDD